MTIHERCIYFENTEHVPYAYFQKRTVNTEPPIWSGGTVAVNIHVIHQSTINSKSGATGILTVAVNHISR